MLSFPTRGLQDCGDIVYGISAALQIALFIVTTMVSVTWLTTTELQPLLYTWLFLCQHSCAILLWRSMPLFSQTPTRTNIRFCSWAMFSCTACMVTVVVLILALVFPWLIFHLAFYSTQCCLWGILFAEICVWERRWPCHSSGLAQSQPWSMRTLVGNGDSGG